MQVDGVSSIGALPFEMDKWRVDVAVTGSQKALSLPTGLGVMAVSEKVLMPEALHLFVCCHAT
jgi:alanine-glyoxylate transaminase / serine-glyoxylate transaminase / serine-pyruvate transaminase